MSSATGRFQHLADRCRQAFAEGDVVGAAVLQALDADLPAAGVDRLGRGVVDGDELGIVDARS